MIKEVQFLDYTNSLLRGDKTKCMQLVEDLLSQKIDIKDIYVDLFQRSMYQIGKMWEQGRISIADEHLGTEITKCLISKYAPKASAKNEFNKTALIACIDKEFHELGAQMAADVFELNGWHTYFLGACTPTREIVKFIEVKKPEIVGLSFNFYLNVHRLIEVIDHILNVFPNQQIIIGGQGILSERQKLIDKYPKIKLFSTIKELDCFIKENSSSNS